MTRLDSRIFQIVFLSSFLTYGLLWLDFEVFAINAATIIGTALLAQGLFLHLFRVPLKDYRSALISSLSLCLLLRSSSLAILAAAAFFTIASKFLIRVRGKHVFNPTNIGIAVPVLLTNAAWISPGQWGSVALVAGFAICSGMYVSAHANRIDISLAFLLSYLSLLVARALWLGDPLSIPLHQLQSGALLIFCFFMISDPMTTPNARLARIFFALTVAILTYIIRFRFFEPNALIYALAMLSPLVPLFDWLFPGRPHSWIAPEKLQNSAVPRLSESVQALTSCGYRALPCWLLAAVINLSGSPAHICMEDFT